MGRSKQETRLNPKTKAESLLMNHNTKESALAYIAKETEELLNVRFPFEESNKIELYYWNSVRVCLSEMSDTWQQWVAKNPN
jgi:hypothetical protein